MSYHNYKPYTPFCGKEKSQALDICLRKAGCRIRHPHHDNSYLPETIHNDYPNAYPTPIRRTPIPQSDLDQLTATAIKLSEITWNNLSTFGNSHHSHYEREATAHLNLESPFTDTTTIPANSTYRHHFSPPNGDLVHLMLISINHMFDNDFVIYMGQQAPTRYAWQLIAIGGTLGVAYGADPRIAIEEATPVVRYFCHTAYDTYRQLIHDEARHVTHTGRPSENLNVRRSRLWWFKRYREELARGLLLSAQHAEKRTVSFDLATTHQAA